ncbi:MAG TPA: hypothetical protein VME43_25015 [Bryobacteraceae bacterium]|nr:hypothetical protein [Bryobacteraceae bacterium]
MIWIHHILAVLRELSGLFLVLVALWIARCAEYLRAIKLHIECLHEDFHFVHHAHDGLADARKPRWMKELQLA